MTLPDLFDDLSKLKLSGGWVVPRARASRKKLPRPKPAGRFLKGPIPWPWLRVAILLRRQGSVLELGLLLWLEAGITRSPTVRVNLSRLEDLGISRRCAFRALRKLEGAGLVSVRRKRGAVSEVTLLEVKDP
jgi:hypothetical protein